MTNTNSIAISNNICIPTKIDYYEILLDQGKRIYFRYSVATAWFSWKPTDCLKGFSTRLPEPNEIINGKFNGIIYQRIILNTSGEARAYGCLSSSFSRLERDIRRRGAVCLYWNSNEFPLPGSSFVLTHILFLCIWKLKIHWGIV